MLHAPDSKTGKWAFSDNVVSGTGPLVGSKFRQLIFNKDRRVFGVYEGDPLFDAIPRIALCMNKVIRKGK